MKDVVIFLLVILFVASCGDGEDNYSYLSQPDVQAETATIKFETASNQSLFEYTLQAKEMVIDWGDGSPLGEYMFFGDIRETDSIKALSYTYTNPGAYDIKVKALQLRALLLSGSGDNSISELILTDCNRLRKLYCEDQPLTELDMKDCRELRVLSCGSSQQELTLNNLSVPLKLGELYINGPLSSGDLDLSMNDSIRILELRKTNLTFIQLGGLPELRSVNFEACPGLTNIYLGENSLLSEVILTNNTSLDAGALNDLFEGLPQTSDDDRRYITLSGNKGDDLCNKNIALSKGWSFR